MNIRTSFNQAHALTEDEMFRLAPSIFARTAHDSRSERFAPIPTIEILRGLTKEGFVPVGAQQSMSKDLTKRPFAKHLIRLRRIDEDAKYSVGDTICEVLLKNANDGTSAYDLLAGLFRIACLNGMIASKGTVDQVKVRHAGDVMDKVIDGSYRVLEQATVALDAPRAWSQIPLAPAERLVFAESARILRVEDQSPIAAEQFLHVRRTADEGADLWSTFNVVQENVMKGGQYGYGQDANNHTRRVSTRAVKAIDGTVRLNQALWTLAAKMAELKTA